MGVVDELEIVLIMQDDEVVELQLREVTIVELMVMGVLVELDYVDMDEDDEDEYGRLLSEVVKMDDEMGLNRGVLDVMPQIIDEDDEVVDETIMLNADDVVVNEWQYSVT